LAFANYTQYLLGKNHNEIPQWLAAPSPRDASPPWQHFQLHFEFVANFDNTFSFFLKMLPGN
jgi:hypothetical protein